MPESELALERGHRRGFLAMAIASQVYRLDAWCVTFPLRDIGLVHQDRARAALGAGWVLLGDWPTFTWPTVADLAEFAGCPEWMAIHWRALATRQMVDRWMWQRRAS